MESVALWSLLVQSKNFPFPGFGYVNFTILGMGFDAPHFANIQG